jgi:hypothetical protein
MQVKTYTLSASYTIYCVLNTDYTAGAGSVKERNVGMSDCAKTVKSTIDFL